MLEADGLHTAACSGGRYARQELLPEIGSAGQAKLRRAKVLIVGAGGLGDIAIRYGYYRYQSELMIITVVLLVIVVQLIQSICDLIARKVDHR